VDIEFAMCIVVCQEVPSRYSVLLIFTLHCSDTVGWVTGSKKTASIVPAVSLLGQPGAASEGMMVKRTDSRSSSSSSS